MEHETTFDKVLFNGQRMPGSPTSLQSSRGLQRSDIQVCQIALTSPGFQIAQRFFTKELSFCINASDLPVIQRSARTYIFVDALSAALGKMTTCLFFFQSWSFFPPFC